MIVALVGLLIPNSKEFWIHPLPSLLPPPPPPPHTHTGTNVSGQGLHISKNSKWTLLPTGDFYPTPPEYQLPFWNQLSCGLQTLLTCCFLPFATIWEHFRKIDFPGRGGGATVIFQTSGHEKLETWKFFFLLKVAEICSKYTCRSEKPFFIIKKWFWHN